jgi:beta-lactamase regulating signal transducer with metallopeptidase domain
MKNNMFAKVVAIIFLIAIVGLLTYFYVSLNRMDKKLTDLQTNLVENSGAVNEVVNFFNANINAGQNSN